MGGMPFELDPTMHADLAPLAWLIGRWEGAGVVGYPTIESANFGQSIEITHDGRPFLDYRSQSWILDEAGERVRPAARESGYFRPLPDGEIELLLTHPTGIVEMYVGAPKTAQLELRTDGVIRSPEAKGYAAGHRLYGLVNSNLLWAMDMAAMDHSLTSHVSAELKRVG